MDRESFELLVKRAVENLPEEFADMLNNVVIVVEDHPTRVQLRSVGLSSGESLLGLYEGVPQTERGHNYGLIPPDKITIFQKPIEALSSNDSEIISEVDEVVKHEIAHHFGISDARLEQIEREKG